MEQAASKINIQNVNEFFKKYSFYIVCFFCLVLSITAIWLNTFSFVSYIVIIALASLFFDANKMIVLSSFWVFFDRTFSRWLFYLYVMSLTVVLLKRIIQRKVKVDFTWIFPLLAIVYFSAFVFTRGYSWIYVLLILIVELFFLREELDFVFLIRALSILLIVSYICSIPFIFYNAGIVVYHDGDIKRYHGFIPHENAVSIISALFISLNILLYFKRKISVWEMGIYVGSLTIMGFLTKSKSFMVLFIVIAIYYFVRMFIINWKNALIQLAIVAAAGGLVTVCFYDKVYDYISRFWLYFSDSSFWDMITTGRITIWSYSINLWVSSFESIMIGNGGGYVMPKYPSPHNAFIDFLLRFGLLGFLVFASLIVYFVILAKKDKKWTVDCFLPVVILILTMLVEIFYSAIGMLMIMSTFAVFILSSEKKTTSDGNIEMEKGDQNEPSNVLE